MLTGERPQLRYEVRVRQEAHIEYEIGVVRNALPVTEAYGGDEDVFCRCRCLEAIDDVRAQFVNRELGSVYDDVGLCANRRQDLAFELDSCLHRLLGAKRMRTAGFAEATNQRLVRGL